MSHKIQHKTPFFSPFSGGQYAPNSPVETCFKDFLNKNTNAVVSDSDIDFLKSIKDIAGFLGCSNTTAQKFKNQHKHIFIQIGRKFLVKKTDIIDALKIKQ